MLIIMRLNAMQRCSTASAQSSSAAGNALGNQHQQKNNKHNNQADQQKDQKAGLLLLLGLVRACRESIVLRGRRGTLLGFVDFRV